MKLIALLVFCSRLLLSETQELHTEEIDCSNEDVFKAVDAALNKYNTRRGEGWLYTKKKREISLENECHIVFFREGR